MKRTSNLIVAVIVSPVLLLAGCVTQDPDRAGRLQAAALNQKHPLEEVRSRAEGLDPGMSRAEVLLQLGSPAVRGADYWDYYPSRTGLLVPAEALRVRFRGDRYVGKSSVPIMLGEELE